MTETDASVSRDIRSRLVALTRDLILIPSDETRLEDIERGLEFIKNHVESQPGIVVEEHRCDGIPSLFVHAEGVTKPRVLLCGHVDVITHPDAQSYKSHIEDGRIYGPGAGDMKGAVAILLELFRSFQARKPGIELGLVITTDEERGGVSGIRHLLQDVGLRCDVAMIPDGGSVSEITVQEKGILHVRIHGHGHAAHAARPWLGTNPLDIIIERLDHLRTYFASLAEDGHRWYPTCTLTVIKTPNRSPNRIPSEAEAVLDIRFTPPHTLESMMTKLREVLGDQLTAEIIMSAEPTQLSPDPLFLEVTEEITGEKPKLINDDGGSDARFLCQYDIPVMVSRPKVGELHSEREWIDIESMELFYRLYERYLERKLLEDGP